MLVFDPVQKRFRPNEEFLMTDVDKAEPAGVERFRAVSHPEQPAAPPVEVSLATLDARLSELEALVHEMAPYSRNANHETIVNYLNATRRRVQAFLKGKS